MIQYSTIYIYNMRRVTVHEFSDRIARSGEKVQVQHGAGLVRGFGVITTGWNSLVHRNILSNSAAGTSGWRHPGHNILSFPQSLVITCEYLKMSRHVGLLPAGLLFSWRSLCNLKMNLMLHLTLFEKSHDWSHHLVYRRFLKEAPWLHNNTLSLYRRQRDFLSVFGSQLVSASLLNDQIMARTDLLYCTRPLGY